MLLTELGQGGMPISPLFAAVAVGLCSLVWFLRSKPKDVDGLTGMVELSDGRKAFLAGAKEASFAGARVDVPPSPKTEPRVGSMDELMASLKDDGGNQTRLRKQLQNLVKKCGMCGKPNGFSLTSCNSCGATLPQELVHTNNIFSGFVYGVGKGPFPLVISMRAQTQELLVIDDLLALTPAHMNVIPATHYIRDLRALLMKPAASLSLLEKMDEAAWSAAKSQFLNNKSFRSTTLRPGSSILRSGLSTFRKLGVAAGMNFPPSQFQLHLQYMLLPLTPFHFSQFKLGNHYTSKRFFPLEYLYIILRSLQKDKVASAFRDAKLNEESSVEDLIDFFRKQGVADYDEILATFTARVEKSHIDLANWKPSDFQHLAMHERDELFEMTEEMQAGVFAAGTQLRKVEGKSKNEVVAEDKMVLQNYGRPYNGTKPGGTYYQFAKDTQNPLPEWV